MKERPILFSAPMVRAILAGRKTQTRRIVKPQTAILTDGLARQLGVRPPAEQNAPVIPCPYGRPGDRLWVRETWSQGSGGHIIYRADHEPATDTGTPSKWRADSRITLEITAARTERLHAITEAEALAEGIQPQLGFSAVQCFAMLWDGINGLNAWAANPWVWVIEFRRVQAT